MKKIMSSVLILLCIFTGCTSGSVETELSHNDINSGVQLETSSETSSVETYKLLLPNEVDFFKDATITITDSDGGTAYMFNIINYTRDEVDNYIDAIKETDFTDVSYESDYDTGFDFGAYSTDGKYWVQVNLDKNNSIVYVTCQLSEK